MASLNRGTAGVDYLRGGMRMRSSNNRLGLIGLLSISTALAVVVVAAATTASQAQFRPSSMSVGRARGGGGMGNMGGSMGSSGFRSEPRFQRFRIRCRSIRSSSAAPAIRGKGKGKGDDVVVNNPWRRRPSRPPSAGQASAVGGPGIGPIIGPAVGTGVAVADAGPAGAGPAGAGPPASAADRRHHGRAARRHHHSAAERDIASSRTRCCWSSPARFRSRQTGAIAARNRLTRIESIYFAADQHDDVPLEDHRRPFGARRCWPSSAASACSRAVQPNFIYHGSQAQGRARRRRHVCAAAAGRPRSRRPRLRPRPRGPRPAIRRNMRWPSFASARRTASPMATRSWSR